jgi:LmbE family N-acetylglucosaminyl deacetylase
VTLQVLAIGAHPDDVELGCLGTLLGLRDLGAHVDVVVTTRAGYSSLDPRNGVSDRTWDRILGEVRAVEERIGIRYQFLDQPGGFLGCNADTVARMDQVIRKGKYDLVITHWPGDHHQDHVATYRIVNSACRRANCTLLCMELALYAQRSIQSFTPNVFVDVSRTFQMKLAALRCYESYITEEILESVEALARARAAVVPGARYVEAFQLTSSIIRPAMLTGARQLADDRAAP